MTWGVSGLIGDILAEPGSDLARPGSGTVEQTRRAWNAEPSAAVRRKPSPVASPATISHAFQDCGAGPARCLAESGRDQARIGLAILGGKRATLDDRAQPGKARHDGVAAQQLEMKSVFGGVTAMLLDDRHIGVAARPGADGRRR